MFMKKQVVCIESCYILFIRDLDVGFIARFYVNYLTDNSEIMIDIL